MTYQQIVLFSLLAAIMVLMFWGRWRHDIVAFAGLMAAVILGVVPQEMAFSGFGNPTTLIVALVLVATAGLTRSGAVSRLTRLLSARDRGVTAHIALFGGVGGFLSGFMNNIAALAMLMPIDMQAARKSGRAAGMTLMPLAFATILGGMLTLIGTPPNLIVSSFRADALGQPYRMFDFLPVGGAVALAGIAFIALFGWRLIPGRHREGRGGATAERPRRYIAKMVVTETSSVRGKTVAEARREAQEVGIRIVGVSRHGHTISGRIEDHGIEPMDVLVLRGDPPALDEYRSIAKLAFPDGRIEPRARADTEGQHLIECLVPVGAAISGRTGQSFGLVNRYDSVLIGMRRRGIALRDALPRQEIAAGDMLLLLVPESRTNEVLLSAGVVRLDGGSLPVQREGHMLTAVGLFAAAVIATSFGVISMPIALGVVVIAYVLFGVLSVGELYDHVDWPVIVLLGAMIPLGLALDQTGGTALIAGGIVALTQGYPAWIALSLLMIVTMLLSAVLNNNATTIIAAPISIRLAEQLSVQPDAFLMGISIAASCAFLTPIGHQNNTLILGPGDYRFGDYWRLGLPLEVIVMAVSVPMLLIVWPL
ncbi:MAG: SLC13 family permease [Paracoccus sp. (in: a-proteobacteria)]|uniref:SLC13 family permease n=1 Tax=unclassified Paracoccus (in: a-proteobacteria) TaxID=2688777 RepID=UPI000C6AA208|nr:MULTISPECIES: SLC13 family permease [unclassified Paracoccus (in: a-proteobacteria)]MAN57000.1 SLC13 family permease [Paracoccus sp. (in: a-proteobacteria)]MBA48693.1 SLC13 family permease [Paracoccus sp. (in: a-proteobacteria)]MCS5603744.1 SLC13 family permease [Paracoccus sp. (in: a-proteobacteria)]|tara:strand:+ start:1767 stop:3548 length:1782 start_codon:yes stop_codon:yes gene_type:complete